MSDDPDLFGWKPPEPPLFNGPEYDDARDDVRLTAQIRRVASAMADGHWRTLAEIEQITGDPQASISAQLRHLRKERFGSSTIERRARGDRSHGLFEYALTLSPVARAALFARAEEDA